MGWYTCRKKEHEYHSGILNRTYCPVCYHRRWQWSDIWGVIWKLIVVLGIAMTILFFAARPLFQRIVNTTIAVLDSTTLYAYSKDAYVESILRGRQGHGYFLITEDTPFYSSILSRERLEDAEPMGILPDGVIVEFRGIIRRGQDVWMPVFFYVQDKPQQAFALFPRNWEDNAQPVDRNEKIEAIKAEYENFVKTEFKDQIVAVPRDEEKDFKEKFNDFFKINDISEDDFVFYAPLTEKSMIDNIRTYYLNRNNMNMEILQTYIDEETGVVWKRPEFVIPRTEVTE
jgi:hypothetical protein